MGDRDLKLSKYVTEINFTSGPVDIVLYLKRLIPFCHFVDPFISRQSVTPKKMTTTKIPLFNIELGETCIFFPDEESIMEPPEHLGAEKLNGNTFCLSIDGLVLTPRPNNPLERHVIIDSVYQSAMDSGLLDSPGSPLEDIQFELDVKGTNIFYHQIIKQEMKESRTQFWFNYEISFHKYPCEDLKGANMSHGCWQVNQKIFF